MKGAPRVLGAQEFTRQLKNRVLAKSPAPAADQKFNTVATSILGNRSNQVVKLVSDPTKSCSGGWTDESDCCACSTSLSIGIDYQDLILGIYNPFFCACAKTVGEECPGVQTLPPTPCPFTRLTLTFVNGGGYELAQQLQIYSVSQTFFDFTGTTVTIDGVPFEVILGPFPGAFVTFPPGTVTQSSVIVFTFAGAVPVLDAVCLSAFSPG